LNESKQNKIKHNKTKHNKTKHNKTKQTDPSPQTGEPCWDCPVVRGDPPGLPPERKYLMIQIKNNSRKQFLKKLSVWTFNLYSEVC
jgi:hypothetical protein